MKHFAVLGLTCLTVAASSANAAIPIKADIATAQAELEARLDRLRSLAPNRTAQEAEIAQWYNWPNWGNGWSNWSNWNNW